MSKQTDGSGAGSGAERRSTGKAELVAGQALKQPGLLKMIIDGFGHADAVVRLRSAGVAEKISREKPELLLPHKEALLVLLHQAREPALRRSLAQLAPRLALSAQERTTIVEVLKVYLADTNRQVQTLALQSLVALTVDDPAQRRTISALVETLGKHANPAAKARARKLKLKFLTLTAQKPHRG